MKKASPCISTICWFRSIGFVEIIVGSRFTLILQQAIVGVQHHRGQFTRPLHPSGLFSSPSRIAGPAGVSSPRPIISRPELPWALSLG